MSKEWVQLKSKSDLPPDDYCGKVEFVLKEKEDTIIGYYDEVYETFESDNPDIIVVWGGVSCFRYIDKK